MATAAVAQMGHDTIVEPHSEKGAMPTDPRPAQDCGEIPLPSAYTQPLRVHTQHFPEVAAAPSPLAGPSRGPPPTLLSSHMLAHPDHTVKRAIQTQFPTPNPILRLLRRFKVKHSVIKGMTPREWERFETMAPELKRKAGWKTAGEGGDGVEVGELFWKMYMSLLPTLERDPLSGLVPPDLLGSTGTIPLTIISLIPDIMQHYHDVIIRAEKEVFLATNYWQPSNSVTCIANSLRELSDLVIKEGRQKIIVKIMYDRGSFEQLWNSHAPVGEDKLTGLDIPPKDEIKGLDLEVINFHRVLLGTFHAKFLIVDRKVALINSNNIQDRPNLELMSHLEGPIVDAFYEIALHSWYNRLSPPLPCMSTPYQPPTNSRGEPVYLFSDHNPFFDDIEILKAARAARLLLRRQTMDQDAELAKAREDHGVDRLREAVRRVVDQQRQSFAEWRPGERIDDAMAGMREIGARWSAAAGMTSPGGTRSRPGSRGPSRKNSAHEGVFRSLMKDRDYTVAHAPFSASVPDPSEAPSSPTVTEVPVKATTYPQPGPIHDETDDRHVAFAPKHKVDGLNLTVPGAKFTASPADSSIHLPASPASRTGTPRILKSSLPGSPALRPVDPKHVSIAEPHDANGEKLPPSAMMPDEIMSPVEAEDDRATIDDERRGNGIHAVESEVPEGKGSRRLYKMSKMFNAAGVLSEAWATVEDSDELDQFRPHVVHEPHAPVPIAMVCRKPHGFPGHHDIRNPQNAAWLAGFRYARKRVFVQSPTLNARPIVRAVKQACRRGVSVELLLDLGFNDKGESIPFQGGTNEEVVDRLYKVLRKEGKEQFLKVYWYTGKDQVRPLNAIKKQRNCHIKFAAYDDEVLIIGNGNQDSQSWFHSQEVNIMVDSKQIVKEMMETLLANQNTIQYGLVDTDGLWRDSEGKTLKDYGATGGGRFRGLSAFIALAKTI